MINNSPAILEVFHYVGILSGCIAAYMLLFISRGNALLKRLLVSLITFFCISFIVVICRHKEPTLDLIILPRTFLPPQYIFPPLLYLYFQTFIQDATKLPKNAWIHFLPIGMHLLYIAPLLAEITLGEMTWAHILSLKDNPDKQFSFGPVPNQVHTLLRIMVEIVYFALILKNYKSHSFSSFILSNKDVYPVSINWIKYYFWIVAIAVVFDLLRNIQFLTPDMITASDPRDTLTWLTDISFLGLLVYLLINPVILLGLPHFLPHNSVYSYARKGEKPTPVLKHHNTRQNSTPSTDNDIIQPVSEYEGCLSMHIPPAYLEGHFPSDSEHQKILHLIDRIDCFVQENQPFIHPSWNMDMLSKELSVPKHHLIYVFSQVLQYSYVDYRNELRVRYAQQALRNGINEYQTIESIGYESGFPSRATFFAVFKKQTGKTPGQFLESLK
jgi:AraC-like DNA-binding protein